MPVMDTCTYCRREWPGMKVWEKKGEKIRVCVQLKCRREAFKAGFRRLNPLRLR